MMTYDSANSIISKAYGSIYKKPLQRLIIESNTEPDNKPDIKPDNKPEDKINKLYGQLFKYVTTNNDQKTPFVEGLIDLLTNKELAELNTKLGLDPETKKYITIDNIVDRTDNLEKTFYEILFPYINSSERANKIKERLTEILGDNKIDVPVYPSTTISTTSAGGVSDGDGISRIKSSDETQKPTASGSSTGKEEVHDVVIPANITTDVLDYYIAEVEKLYRYGQNIRKRLRTIEYLQQEIMSELRNRNGAQNGDTRDWTPTTVPTYLQGKNGKSHNSNSQSQKPDNEEEGGFLNGVKRMGRGIANAGSSVVDTAGGALDTLKGGIDAIGNLFN